MARPALSIIQPPVADIRLPVCPDLPEHQGDGLRPEHEADQRAEDLVSNVGVQTSWCRDIHGPGETQQQPAPIHLSISRWNPNKPLWRTWGRKLARTLEMTLEFLWENVSRICNSQNTLNWLLSSSWGSEAPPVLVEKTISESFHQPDCITKFWYQVIVKLWMKIGSTVKLTEFTTNCSFLDVVLFYNVSSV